MEDESWDVSEDKDLTRVFISCLCLIVGAETEGIPSRDSMSEERDFTKFRKGLSLDGKLKDLVGEEVEPFCSAIRDDRVCVGELLV